MTTAIRTEIDLDAIAEDPADDYALAGFLAHRCGDGMVCIREQQDRQLFLQAHSQGFACEEEYVISNGRDFGESNRNEIDEY